MAKNWLGAGSAPLGDEAVEALARRWASVCRAGKFGLAALQLAVAWERDGSVNFTGPLGVLFSERAFLLLF